MKHEWRKCEDPECTGDCNLCNLHWCKICGAAEGELTTDCPSRVTTGTEREMVMIRKLDFKDGQWTISL